METAGGNGFNFDLYTFSCVMTACFTSGCVGDAINTECNGLTVVGGKFVSSTGYGLNMVSGAGVTTIGVDYSANTAGNTNINTKLIQISPDLGNQLLLGHNIATGANDADIVMRNGGALRGLNAAGSSSENLKIAATGGDDWQYTVPTAADTHLFAWAGTSRLQLEEQNGAVCLRFLGEVSSDPANPAANQARLYLKDNGSGKTELRVRFGTGASQVLATEP